eukprot:CAMPEP_0171174908 /NCGR_PEP_ID=MMETSP0790-20130122/10964_1 /TAXON_ID=2925 /ORGANISM="Alexandrium catenella, Strain OF101" /LENGTH=428 /DNA_ID=CAMNT_0011639785 /DNA_START=147 /DNA_END=1430 /DNA_ORIENTATION=+
MTSLVKCAGCGKKPGTKPNADRGGWADVSSAPCHVQGGHRYDGEGTHNTFANSLRESPPASRSDPLAVDGLGIEGDSSHSRPVGDGVDKRGKIADSFKRFDKNGDGVISKVELKEVLVAISQKSGRSGMTDDHIDKLIEVIDVNGDGYIDYEEFADWVTHPGDGADILQRMRVSAKPLRGPERFFYDKSSYTGSHCVGGGPSIQGCGKVNDLSEITRPASRGHTAAGAARARPTTPQWRPERSTTPVDGPAHHGVHDALQPAKPAHRMVGPERFFYDKSSYTGVHTHGGPSNIGGGLEDQCNDLSEITRPASRGAGGGLRVGRSSRPTTPGRSSYGSRAPSAPSTPARVEEGGHRSTPAKMTGPERFFYDKSSYTGCHKNGGPSSVAKGAGTSCDQSWKREADRGPERRLALAQVRHGVAWRGVAWRG